ncbi:MAG: radical SAM protein [Planctomycetota bacterium]
MNDKLILDGHKLNWHKDRVEAWLAGERIAPITIDCALTRSCNYRCVYCYGQLQNNYSRQLPQDVIYRFLDDAADIGVKGISFVSDGESTCSPHLYNAIIRGHTNGIDMALGTNGYALRYDRLEQMLGHLTYLRFNISAAEPMRYAEIMGCKPEFFDVVYNKIRACVLIKERYQLPVTIGIQMVLLPDFADQIIPLTTIGKDLGVDYLVIKHCSDDEDGSLGVDYHGYYRLIDTLKRAELQSNEKYSVQVKWSKILSDGNRKYDRCYGPPFIIQLSGSGLVAPCGMLFGNKYKKYHIGNIADSSFKELWQGERYWEVMDLLASDQFDPHTMCGCLCLQHKVNEYLYDLKHNNGTNGYMPQHVNFI